ncbi:hypothetical protein A2U01_0109103, partial [Trifolium medium]|nr:hypothetical protein [Trifolium medium]
ALAALTAEITTLTNQLNNNNATTTNNKVDEVEQFHDVTRDSQQDEVVDSEVNDTKSAMVSNTINPKVQSAP